MHQLNLEEKLHLHISKLHKMKMSDFKIFLFDLGISKIKKLMFHYEMY